VSCQLACEARLGDEAVAHDNHGHLSSGQNRTIAPG
jgi:hypothetical protein